MHWRRTWQPTPVFLPGESHGWGSLVGGSTGKESACNAGDLDLIPGSGRSPGEGMATYSIILAWRIPWTEEPGGLRALSSPPATEARPQTTDPSKRKRRLDSLEAAQGAPRDPRRDSRGERCDPIDGSPPGSPVPGILQARTLEWVAISFSNA